jgi:hypothetical protein
MRLWRLILMWVMVAAIPLQGIAASSMLFCAPGPHHAQLQAAEVAPHAHPAGTGSHEHVVKKVQAKVESGSDFKQAQPSVIAALPDAGHKCGVCASCCHSLAITESPRAAQFGEPAPLRWSEAFVLIHSPPAQVPEKPPRV